MKNRLDKVLLAKGIADSRQKVSEIIKSGNVTINDKVVIKPARAIKKGDKIKVKKEGNSWVSRGGLKLDKALNKWSIDVRDLVCVDVGASKGGFTEVLLKGGAKKVYAVDTGTDQLDRKIKNDKRVINLEKSDFRSLKIREKMDFICIDVSYISLVLMLDKVKEILKDGGTVVALVKPQFEIGGMQETKKGIVKDKKKLILALKRVMHSVRKKGFKVNGVTDSPIRGKKGNKEFLLYVEL